MTQVQYETGRVSERCAHSGELFNPGDAYIAALFENESGDGFERRDYRPDAWERMERRPRLFAHWRGVVATPEKQSKPMIDAASLLGLFEQLGESAAPKQVAFRYVLALILLRKRALAPAGNEPGALLVRARGAAPEEAPVRVVDPAMDDAMVAEITEQLRVLLRMEG